MTTEQNVIQTQVGLFKSASNWAMFPMIAGSQGTAETAFIGLMRFMKASSPAGDSKLNLKNWDEAETSEVEVAIEQPS